MDFKVDPARHGLILLSDDDPAVRRSTQLLLRSRGYEVRAYTSGSALLADPLALAAACLIVDYRMPDVDGISLLRSLHAEGWRGAAILISGYYGSELVQRAVQEGFFAVLEKPLRDQLLLDTIGAALIERQPLPAERPGK